MTHHRHGADCGNHSTDTALAGDSRRGVLLGGAGFGALSLFPGRGIAATAAGAIDLAPVALPVASTTGKDPRLLTLFGTAVPVASTDTLKGAWTTRRPASDGA